MKLLIALGLLFLLVVDAGVSVNNQFYCYLTDPIRPHVNMHSTWTAYEAVRRTSINPTVSSCTVSRMWFLFRHGGQFPPPVKMMSMIDLAESSIQADIASNYDAGRTTLCRQDFEAIRDWNMDPQFTMENADLGTDGSKITMQNIAKRYQQYFPTILTENYSSDRFYFRHTTTSRSNTSIRAFASGLFGENENVTFEDVPDSDSLLLPTEFCPAFREEISDQHQAEAFRRGPEFEEMLKQVNRRLGFHGSNQLRVETVLVMWDWCRVLTGDIYQFYDSDVVPWCAAFSISHHHLLEYYSDFYYFYSYGYGVRNQRMVQNLNCGLVQDLLTQMQSDNNTDPTVRVFAGHSPMLMAFVTTFGLFRDIWPLHQHNYAQQTTRQFVSSLIAPNAANFVVVRYDCADGDHDLLFLLNERPLLICGTENGVCKLSFILNRFQRFINANCEELFCSSE